MLNIKKTGLTLSELSELTKISRPTLYKYIDLYIEGNGAFIRHDLYQLFEYIEKNEKLEKIDVYLYYNQLTTKRGK
ncbi:MAG TPA: hypothetical protein VJZ31_00400 [Bacilli bacterium]|nr:hypothetical protein [Bacilli bacterium]